MGDKFDKFQPVAQNLRRLSVGTAAHVNEQGISDEEMSNVDPQEAYTTVKSVVSIPRQAAEEAKENPKVAELKDSLIEAYLRLFSGVANKNPPDRGKYGTAKIKLKPTPKIYRHREYQLQGERAEAMKQLLMEFIERGWIEPSDSGWASPAFIVPKKEKGVQQKPSGWRQGWWKRWDGWPLWSGGRTGTWCKQWTCENPKWRGPLQRNGPKSTTSTNRARPPEVSARANNSG